MTGCYIRIKHVRKSVRLRSNSLHTAGSARRTRRTQTVERTKRFRCSMKTCKLTSSVKIACPAPAPDGVPYMLADMCVVEGLSFESKKRA